LKGLKKKKKKKEPQAWETTRRRRQDHEHKKKKHGSCGRKAADDLKKPYNRIAAKEKKTNGHRLVNRCVASPHRREELSKILGRGKKSGEDVAVRSDDIVLRGTG